MLAESARRSVGELPPVGGGKGRHAGAGGGAYDDTVRGRGGGAIGTSHLLIPQRPSTLGSRHQSHGHRQHLLPLPLPLPLLLLLLLLLLHS